MRQLATAWQFSDDFVRDLFENEAGVIKIGSERSTGRRRRYITLRIPGDVAERVHRRLQISGGAR